MFSCRGSLRVVRAFWVCGTWWPLFLGTCLCALVLAGGVRLWRASWPCVVRRASSSPAALGASVGFPDRVVPFSTLETTDIALTRMSREDKVHLTTNQRPGVRHTGATKPTCRASSRGGTPKRLVPARRGCTGNHAKHHPELWKQPLTGQLVYSQAGGCLPSCRGPAT